MRRSSTKPFLVSETVPANLDDGATLEDPGAMYALAGDVDWAIGNEMNASTLLHQGSVLRQDVGILE